MASSRRINLPIFALFLEAKRIHWKMTPGAVAKAAGVPLGAVKTALDKHAISRGSFLKLCAWQGEEPGIFEARR